MNHVKFSLTLLLSLSAHAAFAMEAPVAKESAVTKSEPIKSLAWKRGSETKWIPTELDQISTHAEEHSLTMMPTLSLKAGYQQRLAAIAQIEEQEKQLAELKNVRLAGMKAQLEELQRRNNSKYAQIAGNGMQIEHNKKAIQELEREKVRLALDIEERQAREPKLLDEYQECGTLIAQRYAEIATATPVEEQKPVVVIAPVEEQKPVQPAKKGGLFSYFRKG